MDWQAAARALAGQLIDARELTDPAWRLAFEQVPRHEFVPGFNLEDAYQDKALVTQQRRATGATGGDGVDLPTSSASAPGVVAVMLERLDIAPDMRVLEIGTGAGYNAALLCHRVGDGNVCSIELDPTLLDTADSTLNHAGFRPHLDAGDGYGGWPSAAPFDRIIATCAVDHIPPAWIEQLAPRGRVVAPLLGDECALMVLDKTSDDEVTGRFDSYRVSFMPLRDQPDNPLGRGRVLGGAVSGIGQYGTTDLDPATFEQADLDLVLLLHLHLPGLVLGSAEGPDGKHLALSTPDASALVAGTSVDNRWGTIHHGRRLWDTAEYVSRLWQLLGQPDRGRYGISALNDATRQYVWLDHPDSRYAWQLPL